MRLELSKQCITEQSVVEPRLFALVSQTNERTVGAQAWVALAKLSLLLIPLVSRVERILCWIQQRSVCYILPSFRVSAEKLDLIEPRMSFSWLARLIWSEKLSHSHVRQFFEVSQLEASKSNINFTTPFSSNSILILMAGTCFTFVDFSLLPADYDEKLDVVQSWLQPQTHS